MRRALLFCWIAVVPSLVAADHWYRYTSGPFEVLTDAGEKTGQETLVHFEEFRHALGTIVCEDDLQTPQPVRILIFKNSKDWTSPSPLAMGRGRYAIVRAEKAPVTPEIFSALTRL